MWVTPVKPVGKDPELAAESAGPVPPRRNPHASVLGSGSSGATAVFLDPEVRWPCARGEGDKRAERSGPRRCPVREPPGEEPDDEAGTGAEGDPQSLCQTDGRERSVRRQSSCTDFRARRRDDSVEGTAEVSASADGGSNRMSTSVFFIGGWNAKQIHIN